MFGEKYVVIEVDLKVFGEIVDWEVVYVEEKIRLVL